ncbi:MAG: ABC transporter permease subunit [Chthoniobacterales bacterium]|nr:ABC transporter permease subunit [Chthoniobacterales bacterium]
MSNPAHRAISLGRITALTSNTLTELTRLKLFYFLLLFALLLIGSSAFMARLSFQQEFQVLKDISLGAMSIFTSILAIVAAARMLPQDLEDRTIYTILAKPVSRFEYLVGKLAGVLLLLLISTVVMTLLFCVALFLREHAALAEVTRQMSGAPAEQLQEALQGVRNSTFNADLVPGIAIIYLKASLLASLTLFISTFATTNIFTIVVTVFVYFIGHIQGTAREFWLQQSGGTTVARVFLAFVALVFPDLQLFDFADDLVAGAAVPLSVFANAAGFGCFYTVLYLLLATAVFSGREL